MTGLGWRRHVGAAALAVLGVVLALAQVVPPIVAVLALGPSLGLAQIAGKAGRERRRQLRVLDEAAAEGLPGGLDAAGRQALVERLERLVRALEDERALAPALRPTWATDGSLDRVLEQVRVAARALRADQVVAAAQTLHASTDVVVQTWSFDPPVTRELVDCARVLLPTWRLVAPPPVAPPAATTPPPPVERAAAPALLLGQLAVAAAVVAVATLVLGADGPGLARAVVTPVLVWVALASFRLDRAIPHPLLVPPARYAVAAAVGVTLGSVLALIGEPDLMLVGALVGAVLHELVRGGLAARSPRPGRAPRDPRERLAHDAELWLRVAELGLTAEQGWDLVARVEAAAGLVVRTRRPDLVEDAALLVSVAGASPLDRRDLVVVASLVRRGADLAALDYPRLALQGCRRAGLHGERARPWLLTVSADTPPSHREAGAAASFDFVRNPVPD